MGSEWRETTLGEFAPFNYGKGLPKRKRNPEGGIPVYGSNGITGHHDEALIEKGIIIGRKGSIGEVEYSEQPFWPIDTTFYVEESPERDIRFTYYLLKSLPLQEMNSDSAVPGLNRNAAHSLKIKVPNLAEQKRIAHILGTLDDKIELNQRMNETLEAIARAIFKSWFVDFDPVKAKMAGEPYPLPNEIMGLFPDELVESKLGMIPKGWEVGKLEDLAEKVENGGTPKRSEPLYWSNGYIPWLTSGEVRQNLISSTDNFISELGLKNSSAKIWEPGTTIVALYGATAGEVTMSNIKLTANQACCGLSPKEYCQYYLYLTASRATDLLANQARGSAQQNLSQGIVKNFKCILPSSDLLIEFENLIVPIYEKIILNLEEIAILCELRDLLLPKLMSGEVEV